jgi:hypothetical protein
MPNFRVAGRSAELSPGSRPHHCLWKKLVKKVSLIQSLTIKVQLVVCISSSHLFRAPPPLSSFAYMYFTLLRLLFLRNYSCYLYSYFPPFLLIFSDLCSPSYIAPSPFPRGWKGTCFTLYMYILFLGLSFSVALIFKNLLVYFQLHIYCILCDFCFITDKTVSLF